MTDAEELQSILDDDRVVAVRLVQPRGGPYIVGVTVRLEPLPRALTFEGSTRTLAIELASRALRLSRGPDVGDVEIARASDPSA